MTLQLLFEWTSLILLLGLGIYTLSIIKNEKKTYIKNAREIQFKEFKFFVPCWWGEMKTQNSESELFFKRLDTRYDWEAHFIWNEKSPNQNITELFKEHIHQRKILFDEENCIIHNPSDFKDSDLIKSGLYEMVRLEGTATADRAERLYYDAFLIRNIKTGSFLYAESKSSILNGLVEGPYFEAVMTGIKLFT